MPGPRLRRRGQPSRLALVADLTEMGFSIVVRAASQQAIDLAGCTPTSCHDLHLAGAIDGRGRRLDSGNSSARIVFITAFSESPERARMDALRPTAVLGKPYNPDALAEIVGACSAWLWARRRELAITGIAD